jgi:hypothetical protein
MAIDVSERGAESVRNKSVDHSAKVRVIDKRVEPLLGSIESNTKKINS